MSGRRKPMATGRLAVAGGCQVGWEVTTNGSGLSCWGGDNVLDLDSGDGCTTFVRYVNYASITQMSRPVLQRQPLPSLSNRNIPFQTSGLPRVAFISPLAAVFCGRPQCYYFSLRACSCLDLLCSFPSQLRPHGHSLQPFLVNGLDSLDRWTP